MSRLSPELEKKDRVIQKKDLVIADTCALARRTAAEAKTAAAELEDTRLKLDELLEMDDAALHLTKLEKARAHAYFASVHCGRACRERRPQ